MESAIWFTGKKILKITQYIHHIVITWCRTSKKQMLFSLDMNTIKPLHYFEKRCSLIGLIFISFSVQKYDDSPLFMSVLTSSHQAPVKQQMAGEDQNIAHTNPPL